MPADAREVQASLRAADICWQRFAYFEHRYGERRRRFARSDAAWLASLCQFEPGTVVQQIRWLGRVLAARGMPTLLLQVQLEILTEELTAAIPDKKLEFAKLSLAANELHASRRRHLSDEQCRALAAQFDAAAPSPWSDRLPRTGDLLASAVADEREGYADAVEAFRQWVTEPARFPVEWIAAVEATLAQAQEQVPGGSGGEKIGEGSEES